MNITYESNGKLYSVGESRLEEFLKLHPNAKKKAGDGYTDGGKEIYYNVENDKYKPYSVSKSRLEEFKSKYPEARTKQGWEDYIKEQKEKAAKLKEAQGIIDAENEEKQNKKEQAIKENELLVKEHDTLQDRDYAGLTKIYKDAGGPQFYIKEGEEEVGRKKMVDWLKKNKYKNVDFSRDFNIDEDIIDESKLDMPTYINVMGVETDQPTNSEDNKLGDDYIQKVNNYNSSIQKILNNPIIKDGKVDYEATQAAIDEIEANVPDGLILKDDIDDALSWEQLNDAERRRYKELLNEIEANPNLKDMEVQYDGFGKPIPQLVQGVDPDDKTLPYNFSDEEKRKHIFDIILEERKQKLEQYKKGEIELTTEELAQVGVADPGFVDYVKRFFPSAEQMTELEDPELSTEQNVINTLNNATNAAVMSDPRFKFIQQSIVKEVDKNAKAKIEELRDKYNLLENPSTETLKKIQEEFTNWYNTSVGEKMQGNKSLVKLYQEYGVASFASLPELSKNYLRYKDDFLRTIDENIKKYDDGSTFGMLMVAKEKARELFKKSTNIGYAPSTWGNAMQIGLKNLFFIDGAREDVRVTKEDIIGNNGITADTTVGEAKVLWNENPENVNKYGDQTLLPVSAKVSNDMTIGELLKQQEDYLKSWTDKDFEDDNWWETIDVDIEEQLAAYGRLEAFNTYDEYDSTFGPRFDWADYFAGITSGDFRQGLLPDNLAEGGLFGYTLEGFLDRSVSFVDQLQHQAPSYLGKGLI